MNKRKTLSQLVWEGKNRDNSVFELSHKDATETLGLSWFHSNRKVVEVLSKFGYQTDDKRVRAIASLVVRTILDKNFYEDVYERDMFHSDYHLEIDFPFLSSRVK